MTVNQPRKNGEKAELLKCCGQTLFGCDGEILVTQGIYCCPPFGKKAECFCKRAVWVPRHFNLAALKETFFYHSAEFPLTVTEDTPVGVCGQAPTRTAHADDKVFLILAQFVKKKFSVIGTVAIAKNDKDGTHYITEIKSGSSLFDAVTWVREESSIHRTTHMNRSVRYRKRKQDHSDCEELKSEDQSVILKTPVNKKPRIDYSQLVETSPKTPEMNNEKHAIVSTPMAPSSGRASPDFIQQMYLPDPAIYSVEQSSTEAVPENSIPVERAPVDSVPVVQASAPTVQASIPVSIPAPFAVNPQNLHEECFWVSEVSPSLPNEHAGLFCRSPSFYEPNSDTLANQFSYDTMMPWTSPY